MNYSTEVNRKTKNPRYRWFRDLIRNKTALLGLVLLLPMLIGAVFANSIAGIEPTEQNLLARLSPPGEIKGDLEFILGTDSLGRDIYSRILHGGRLSLFVAGISVLISAVLGVSVGLIAGYYRGRIDSILMRIADIQLAIPPLILALTIMAIFGQSLWNVILVLGITGWVSYARIVRSEVLSIREKEYVKAARALGGGNLRVMLLHILPNVTASIIIMTTLRIGAIILMEATLSFLGLGVQPPTPTWGNMIADGRDILYNAWWVSVFPGIALSSTVIGINLLGDWLRDILDPRLKGDGLSASKGD